MSDLQSLYKLEKGPTANTNIPENSQWEAVLLSSHDKIVQNGMFLAQQWLQEGKGFDTFKTLIYSTNDSLVQNTMHLLVNYSNNKEIVAAINSKGLKRQIELIKNTKPPKKIILLQFLVNLLTEASCHTTFVSSGGLSFALDLLHWTDPSKSNNSSSEDEEEINTLGSMILSPLMAARAQSRDYSIFSSIECFNAFTSTLEKPNISEDSRRIVLSILANLLATENNRKLFLQANGTVPLVKILQKNLKTDPLQDIILTLVSNVIADLDIGMKLVEGPGVTAGIMEFLNFGNPATLHSTIGIVLNLATQEELVEKSMKDMVAIGVFDKLLIHVRASNSTQDTKARAALALSNLMMHEDAQKHFLEVKQGIRTLITATKSEKDETVSSRLVTAIFHMTMHSDILRNAIIKEGLEELSAMIANAQTPAKLKKELVKAVVNLCLADGEEYFVKRVDLIKALLELIGKSSDAEMQEVAAIALENLSTNSKVNSVIEKNGGFAASIEFLKSARDPKTQEHSAILISRFAVNSKMRSLYQDNKATLDLLKKVDKEGNDIVKKAALLACNNVAVPHFENLEPVNLATQPKEFAEFEQFQLEESNSDDDEIFNNYDDDEESSSATALPPKAISAPAIISPASGGGSNSSSSSPSSSSPTLKPPGFLPNNRPASQVILKTKVPLAIDGTKVRPKSELFTEAQMNSSNSNINKSREGPPTRSASVKPSVEVPEWQRKIMSKKKDSIPEVEVIPTIIDPVTGEEVEDRSLALEFYDINEEDEPQKKSSLKEAGKNIKSKIRGDEKPTTSSSSSSSNPRASGTFNSASIGVASATRYSTASVNGRLSLSPATGASMNSRPRSVSGGTNPAKQDEPKLTEAERLAQARLHFRRTRVAQELLDTEGAYVRNLAIAIKKFQNPLFQMSRTKKYLLSGEKIRIVFSSIEIIYGCNSMLLEGLNNKMARWSSRQCLGDVFLYMADFFRVYCEYINNYDKAQKELIKACAESYKLTKWLENVRNSDVVAGQSLMSFLIMPVQRMPRYELLLKELHKATPEGHQDADHLQNAIQRINDVNNYLNNKKKEADDHFKMIELAEKLIGKAVKNLLNPRRSFIWEAEITWMDVNADGKDKEKIDGEMVIFTDLLVLTKLHKKKQKVMFVVPFVGLHPKWQADMLSFRYDALRTHVFEIKFKTNAAYITTKQKLDGLLKQ